jgi:hypothetical protein
VIVKRYFLVLVAVLLMTQASWVLAAKPIENIEGSRIPAGLTDEQIQAAMVTGGKIRGWIVKPVDSGHMEATLFVRSHMAKVDIRYDANTYSITYKDSENLGYENGKIHRNYNKWIANLNMDIQRAFAL